MGHFIVEHAVAGQPALSGAARWFGRARIVSLVFFAAALAAGCNLPSGVQSAPPATLTPPPPPVAGDLMTQRLPRKLKVRRGSIQGFCSGSGPFVAPAGAPPGPA